MSWKSTLLPLSLLAGAYATPVSQPSHESISWGPCITGLDPTLRCGNLTVPRDYSNPSPKDTIQLQLLKVPAAKGPKKGSILFNFGGPGLEARYTLAGQAAELMALTGGEHDLIAHDPRGTAQTFTANCFNNTQERFDAIWEGSMIVARPDDELSLGKQYGTAKVAADACGNFPSFQKQGEVLGTVSTAKDLMSIVDALDEDGMLRYWGLSYGTVLGSTVAAMFPDRIDRMIIDGVMNGHQYWNAYDTELWAGADWAFSHFIQYCLQDPKHCGFTHRNQTAFDIEKDVYNKVNELRRDPLVYNNKLIDASLFLVYIRIGLYSPSGYSDLSKAIDAVLSNDAATFMKLFEKNLGFEALKGLLADESPFAIPCGDKIAPEQTLNELGPVFDELYDNSALLGGFGISYAMTCSNWKFQAKERYTGNFNVKTKHPMLVIGNTYDVATPFVSAKNMSESFQNAALLQHHGFGHGSSTHGSACTSKVIRNYFTKGVVPEKGTVCPTSYGPFEPKSLLQVLQGLGWVPKAAGGH